MADRLTDEAARKADAFIRENLPLTEVPGTGLRLHLAGPRSGLSRLVPPGETPYWAYAWPGGIALAMHLAAHPEAVAGRAVLDLGTGSGLAALAALRAGAEDAAGLDTDPLAEVAARRNAEDNGLDQPAVWIGPPEQLLQIPAALREVESLVILAGDLFYDDAVSRATTATLDGAPRGATILVGDIGRRYLPLDRLEPLASYPVRDVGDPPSAPLREGRVFRWKPRP